MMSKLEYKFSHISDKERVEICNRYIKYTDYKNIDYWSYDYCHLYDFEIIKEDLINYDEDGDVCGFIPKGELHKTRECIKTFEEIYIELELLERS
jgi:hypothetical protein